MSKDKMRLFDVFEEIAGWGLFAYIYGCLTLLYIHCPAERRRSSRHHEIIIVTVQQRSTCKGFIIKKTPWSHHLVDEWVSKQSDPPDTLTTVCNSAEYQSRETQHALFDVMHTANTTRGWLAIFMICEMRCLCGSARNWIIGYLWSEDDEPFWIVH